ncbi:MAG TPA: rhomboid family intramembrane serine protease [Thermoflexales bacterium]|nr:rhomboid family intramembrane serine protease [Thermoflexales bacterium]HQX12377.1 rhomboid family intramembrane serine protease [Thermoflexales bacterium]HQY26037.1 rhomboid family intramembrane serine protease [Thermoflexales bacterium]HRA55680.1 rhomboid family intramembrane serine protease [Thermoflexales bacterium]
MAESLSDLWRHLKPRLALLLGIVGLMWLLEIVDTLFLGQRLNSLGIHPRDLASLPNVLLAPFLHAGFTHLIANSVPFAVLGGIILARSVGEFVGVSLVILTVSGLGIWQIGGSNTVHFGASGMVFGYFGYLLFRGIFERSLPSIFIAVVVAAAYGSILFGVLPGQRGVSWEGHLFGFLGGALAAWLGRKLGSS